MTETYTVSGKQVPIRNEDDLQIACVEHFRKTYGSLRRMIHHSPNEKGKGTKFGSSEGAKARVMGTLAGWPDLEIMVPRDGYHGLFVELKYKDGSLSQHQAEILEQLRENGYMAVVCRSLAGFTELVSNYLGVDV